jgi:Fuc2NAc and GlcNAc transferase
MNFIIIFLLSVISLYFYSEIAIKYHLLDKPNERSSHNATTPRGGGIVFISLWIIAVLICYFSNNIPVRIMSSLVLPVAVLSIISFLDDYLELRQSLRLLIHLIVSLLFLCFIDYRAVIPSTSSFSFLIGLNFLMAIFSIWSINLFNFMDGLDGFAAIQSIFIFMITGVFLYAKGNSNLGSLSCLLAFSVMGFLVWNWPTAKIFMGDVGSTSLGLLVVIFMLWASKLEALSPVTYIVLYLPFLFDATVTLMRRMLRGEKWYKAHNNHAYQRLHRAGWSHRKVLLGLIGVDSILGLFVILMENYTNFKYFILTFSLFMMLMIYYQVERIFPMPYTILKNIEQRT